jgi:predicted extracellular nuclease
MKHLKTAVVVGACALGFTACSDRGGGSSSTTGGGTGGADTTVAPGTDTGGTGGTDDTGGTGGTDAAPQGDPTEQTIEAIQTSTGSTTCDATKITNVMSNIVIRGAIVTAGKFEAFKPAADSTAPALDGYYVAEGAGGQNKGIQITVPTSAGTNFVPGDVVDVYGEYLEFYCSSQVKASKVEKTSTGPAPVATVITGDMLPPTAATSEPYEGTLVQLNDVKVESLADYEYVLTGGAHGAGGQYKPGYFATAGDELTSITGVVDFSYGTYKIQPRNLADIVVKTLAPSTEVTIEEIQSAATSTGCADESGTLPPTQTKVRVSGIVVSPVQDASANLSGVYLSSEAPGANSGLFVLFPKAAGATANVGDLLTAEGNVVEYYCLTELKATAVQVTGAGTAPAPATVTAADLAGATAEAWEGTYVKLENVTVSSTDNLDKYNEVEVESGLVLAGDDFGIKWTVKVGDKITSVTGAVKYAFKKYRVVPFSDASITLP